MPRRRARRPCIEPGCTQLSKPGHSRCPGHQKQREAVKYRRRAARSTGAAKRLRRTVNRTGFGLCAECNQVFPSGGIEVDHRREVADGGTDSDDNLQLLCVQRCHPAKSAAAAAARRARAQ